MRSSGLFLSQVHAYSTASLQSIPNPGFRYSFQQPMRAYKIILLDFGLHIVEATGAIMFKCFCILENMRRYQKMTMWKVSQ